MRSEIKFGDKNKICALFEDVESIFIIDKQVISHHEWLASAITANKVRKVMLLEGGEKIKNFKTYEETCEFFLNLNIHRQTKLVAIGGGALTDLAGFVAATLLRGLTWQVVPTTLLGMIDAAIGGKTALNSKVGKNLIGAFHLPESVLIYSDFLHSLPETQIQSGLGELLKYAFISSDVSALLEKGASRAELIIACARYKEEVVTRDLHELGERKYLNFGHTLGHALERIYEISHGEAVFWGSFLILSLYHPEHLSYFTDCANKLNSAFKIPPWQQKGLDLERIESFLLKDKKKINQEEIDLVLIKDPGTAYLKNEKISELMKRLSNGRNEIEKFHL